MLQKTVSAYADDIAIHWPVGPAGDDATASGDTLPRWPWGEQSKTSSPLRRSWVVLPCTPALTRVLPQWACYEDDNETAQHADIAVEPGVRLISFTTRSHIRAELLDRTGPSEADTSAVESEHAQTESGRYSTLLMQYLELAAHRSQNEEFSRLVRRVPWERGPAGNLARVIALTMSLGMFTLARELSHRGKRCFPRDECILALARVFDPPTVTAMRSSESDLSASKAWLHDHAGEYSGMWVAVRDGRLLSAASSLEDLQDKIESNPHNTLVTRVGDSGEVL